MNLAQLYTLTHIENRLGLLSATTFLISDSLQRQAINSYEIECIELVAKNLAYEIYEQKEQLSNLLKQLCELVQGVTA